MGYNGKAMIFYLQSVERVSLDPQEAREMAAIRLRSARWLLELQERQESLYVFRNWSNRITHLFLEVDSHLALHKIIDSDPLISYSSLEIEPLLTPIEMALSLEGYLNESILSKTDWEGLDFPRRKFDPSKGYYFARKEIAPFSPLLQIDDQNDIHRNTLRSQTAHDDDRELADYNPVGKPVGLLIMEAESEDEVMEHVMGCEVYVDSRVTIEKILLPAEAISAAIIEVRRNFIGCFTDRIINI